MNVLHEGSHSIVENETLRDIILLSTSHSDNSLNHSITPGLFGTYKQEISVLTLLCNVDSEQVYIVNTLDYALTTEE